MGDPDGAAAGTALLGPVLGTTLGMQATRMTQRFFGGKPKKKKIEPAPTEATRQAKDEEAASENKRPSSAHTGR